MPEDEAAQVMGSRGKLAAVMRGADLLEVVNAGVEPRYRTVRLGQTKAVDSPPMTSAYEAAKIPGAKNHGMLKNLEGQGGDQLRQSAGSLLRQAKDHEAKMANPASAVENWDGRDQRYRDGLLAKWRKEAENFRLQADIVRGYIDDKGI